jgi:hypothetical protein
MTQTAPTHKPSPEERSTRDINELYLHLDHVTDGDRHMSLYGQCRAQGYTHTDALHYCISYFDLNNKPWYIHRFPNGRI